MALVNLTFGGSGGILSTRVSPLGPKSPGLYTLQAAPGPKPWQTTLCSWSHPEMLTAGVQQQTALPIAKKQDLPWRALYMVPLYFSSIHPPLWLHLFSHHHLQNPSLPLPLYLQIFKTSCFLPPCLHFTITLGHHFSVSPSKFSLRLQHSRSHLLRKTLLTSCLFLLCNQYLITPSLQCLLHTITSTPHWTLNCPEKGLWIQTLWHLCLVWCLAHIGN